VGRYLSPRQPVEATPDMLKLPMPDSAGQWNPGDSRQWPWSRNGQGSVRWRQWRHPVL